MNARAGLYSLDNVSFGYAGTRVIEGLSVSFEEGKLYAVVGPNGCGKTTLLHLLAGYLRPDAGSIRLKGKPLDRYPRRDLARQVALVPQDFTTGFPFTAREVVMMGRYPHLPRFSLPSARDQALVDEALAATDTAPLAQRLMTELSGGERQRVVVARALAQDTPCLLLDEATSNLDIRHALALLEGVRERIERKGRSAVAVFHDLNLAIRFCDDLVLMKEGRILACGAVKEVLTAENLERVFAAAARVRFEPFIQAAQVAFATEKPGSAPESTPTAQ